MGQILVGTGSWADKSLLDSGLFYPKQAKTAEARLRYYSTHFPLVEVDSSYYAMPAPQVAQLWAERTPETFVFDVKAFRIFTQHQTPPNVLPKDIREALGPLAQKKNVYYADLPPDVMEEMWRRFRLALEPLRQANKLGAVLFQFPPWFFYRRSNLEHIARCAQILERYQLAVEFRNRTWFEDKHQSEVLAFERDHRLAHVIVDEPQGFSSSIPAVWEVTCPALAIFRLHGRNAQTWVKKGLTASSERFDYTSRWPLGLARSEEILATNFTEAMPAEAGRLSSATISVRMRRAIVRGRAEQTHGGGDIQKHLVQRERFHQRGVALEDGEHLLAGRRVGGEPGPDDDGEGRQRHRASHGHRAVHAAGAHLVGGG